MGRLQTTFTHEEVQQPKEPTGKYPTPAGMRGTLDKISIFPFSHFGDMKDIVPAVSFPPDGKVFRF